MTLEEAKKLKPGDRILVEMVVRRQLSDDNPLNESDGTVATLAKWIHGQEVPDSQHYSIIREKIAPPRRKFKAGDIVKASGILWKVDEDENSDAFVRLSPLEKFIYYSHADIELLCAAEDRKDRPTT